MTVYLGIFKEPRGLLRFLQFLFAIFAFATACNGSSSLSFKDNANKEIISASWSYPYHLSETPLKTDLNQTQETLSQSNDIKPSAEFFVFTGVTSMLLTLAMIVAYVLADRVYRNDERLPIIDLIITLIWAFFWIVGSSAWAQGVSNLRLQTSIEHIKHIVTNCKDSNVCDNWETGTYANVTVSVIFGFLNFLLWFCSIWFIYKETKYFKSRTAQQQPQPPAPPLGQNNFSNIAAPTMTQPRAPGTLG